MNGSDARSEKDADSSRTYRTRGRGREYRPQTRKSPHHRGLPNTMTIAPLPRDISHSKTTATPNFRGAMHMILDDRELPQILS